MNKKDLMQKVLGNTGTEIIIYFRNQFRHFKASTNKTVGKIKFSDNRQYTEYSVPGKNLFFGYYDLSQYNTSMDKMLAHIVKKMVIHQKT